MPKQFPRHGQLPLALPLAAPEVRWNRKVEVDFTVPWGTAIFPRNKVLNSNL